MGITFIIVGGITLISIIAVIGDYATKSKIAKSTIDPEVVYKLENRVQELERKVNEQDTAINRLESDLKFTNKLLDDKTK